MVQTFGVKLNMWPSSRPQAVSMTQRISPCSSLASSSASPPPGSPCSTLQAGGPESGGAYGSITSPTSTLESRDSGIIGESHDPILLYLLECLISLIQLGQKIRLIFTDTWDTGHEVC